jgi:hypothetical protein
MVMVLIISLASEAAASASELLFSCGLRRLDTMPQSSQQKLEDFFAKRRRSGIVTKIDRTAPKITYY